VASKKLSNVIFLPDSVAQLPCVECGKTMHRVRRLSVTGGERQLFICASCGGSAEWFIGRGVSDADIANFVEERARLRRIDS
jgi:hypothetical protein